jgi:hypothetical protein
MTTFVLASVTVKLLPLVVLLGMVVSMLPLSLNGARGSPGARLSLIVIFVVALVAAVAIRLLPMTLGFSKDGSGGVVGVSMIILAFVCLSFQGLMLRQESDTLGFVGGWHPGSLCMKSAQERHVSNYMCHKRDRLYNSFWLVFSGCAIIGAFVFRRGRVTGGHDDAVLHQAMRGNGTGSDSDDDAHVAANKSLFGRASPTAALWQREETQQQRFWKACGTHPYEEVVTKLTELRCNYTNASRYDALDDGGSRSAAGWGDFVDPVAEFDRGMLASVWRGQWYSHPLLTYIAAGISTGVLVFFADEFEYIFGIHQAALQSRDVVFAVLSAIGHVAIYTAGMLLTFRSTFEPVRFVRYANKAVADVLARIVDEQRKLSDVMPLRTSRAASELPPMACVPPPSSQTDATVKGGVAVPVRRIDAAPFVSSLRSLPMQELRRPAAAGVAAVTVAVPVGVGIAVEGATTAMGHIDDDRTIGCVADAVAAVARRDRRILRLDLADWFLLRENVQWRNGELMARASVGLLVIFVTGLSQVVDVVKNVVRSRGTCALSLELLATNCHNILGGIGNAAAFWAWLAVAMLVLGWASMHQQRDAVNMGVLCHLVDIANDSVVTDSRQRHTLAELKLLLAARAKNLQEHDRWPSLFDTLPVSPKVVYLASTWIIAPLVALSFRQLQALFSQERTHDT